MNSKASTLNSPMLPERVAQCILHDWKEPLLLVDSELRHHFRQSLFLRLGSRAMEADRSQASRTTPGATHTLPNICWRLGEHNRSTISRWSADVPRFGDTTALLNVKSLASSKRGEAILIRFSEIVEPRSEPQVAKTKDRSGGACGPGTTRPDRPVEFRHGEHGRRYRGT